MPRYELVWVEIARRQYADFPATVRQLIDRRIEELLEEPTGDPRARYYPRMDEWSVPFGPDDEGLIDYAIVDVPGRVVILRRIVFAGTVT